MLHLAGIIWTDPQDTREIVRRLQEPGYPAEWSRPEVDDSPVVPLPATASDDPRITCRW